MKAWVGLYENMATENSKTCEKRRGTYLSYLSHPSLKVPRTSKYRQKLAKTDGERNAASCTCNDTAALKHGIRNPETERNTESNINDRKFKNFTLHNLVQSKKNLF